MQISSAMVQASSGSLPSGFGGFSANKVCNDTTAGQEVTVTINNGSLSGSVQEAFQISIPFLPPFTLNPKLSGSFRCE
jgi:hypothetical protein